MLLSTVYTGLAPQLPVTPSVPKKQMERTWGQSHPSHHAGQWLREASPRTSVSGDEGNSLS